MRDDRNSAGLQQRRPGRQVPPTGSCGVHGIVWRRGQMRRFTLQTGYAKMRCNERVSLS